MHFEGVIPAGEYGGGSVIVWDKGTWEAVPGHGFHSGDFKFCLRGEKLQGRWMLVHTGQRQGDPRHWLLFKERDAFARPAKEIDVLTAFPLSVVSGKSLEEVAQAPVAVWDSYQVRPVQPDSGNRNGPKTTFDKAPPVLLSQVPRARRARMPQKPIVPSLPTAARLSAGGQAVAA